MLCLSLVLLIFLYCPFTSAYFHILNCIHQGFQWVVCCLPDPRSVLPCPVLKEQPTPATWDTQHHLRKDSQAKSVSLSTEGMDGVGEVSERGSGDKEEEKLLKERQERQEEKVIWYQWTGLPVVGVDTKFSRWEIKHESLACSWNVPPKSGNILSVLHL